jgi:kynurenine formamidase
MEQPNDPRTGLEFYDLSAPFGHGAPLWPYFEDVVIERKHYHAKSGVLSQKITTVMHCTTHTDAPAHVIEGTEFTDEVPLYKYFGPGVVVSVPKEDDWAPITREDLERATPKIMAGDIVIINCG